MTAVEASLSHVLHLLRQVGEECANESTPITCLRTGVLLDRAREAIHRLVDARLERDARGGAES